MAKERVQHHLSFQHHLQALSIWPKLEERLLKDSVGG